MTMRPNAAPINKVPKSGTIVTIGTVSYRVLGLEVGSRFKGIRVRLETVKSFSEVK